MPSPRDLVLANLGLLLMVLSWGAFFPILERILHSWDVFSATLARQICGAGVLMIGVMTVRHCEPLPASVVAILPVCVSTQRMPVKPPALARSHTRLDCSGWRTAGGSPG